LLVGIGGFLGAISRYGISLWLRPIDWLNLYWGTLTVNLLGTLLLGALLGFADATLPKDHWTIRLLGIGFCGSFTTFSTFAGELFTSTQDGRWAQAMLYLGISLITGVLLFALGWWLGGQLR
ncbi:MAG: fluoride efflux transporter CrcB, partial [Bacteroidota bacterium]